MFIVPPYWLDYWGRLKPEAICTLAVFFGDMTNEKADIELARRKKSAKEEWYL